MYFEGSQNDLKEMAIDWLCKDEFAKQKTGPRKASKGPTEEVDKCAE